MRRPFFGIAIALITFIAGTAIPARTQQLRSFDPNQKGACEKALGYSPTSDDIDNRTFAYDCGELDLQIEKSELSTLCKASAPKSRTERATCETLVAAFENYRKLHMAYETASCGGGNGCETIMDWDDGQSKYEFLAMMEKFREGGTPSYPTGVYPAADAKLNDVYSRLMSSLNLGCSISKQQHAKQFQDDFCAEPLEMRDEERAWIRYRDAWVAYGAVRWPRVAADSWRAYLTLQRLAQLDPQSFPATR